MRVVSAAMRAHLAASVTTLCSCVLISRRDGLILGYTDLDASITVDGQVYNTVVGYQRTAITGDSGLTVDNSELLGVFDDESITETDLRAGLFDFARLEMFCVNWADLTMGRIVLRNGILGEVSSRPSGIFTAELRGLTQLLTNQIGQLYSASCRASLGDARCKVPIHDSNWLHSAAVSRSNGDSQTFWTVGITDSDGRTQDGGWFREGVVTWTSGQNMGRSMEVKIWDPPNQGIGLFMPMPRPVQVGDAFTITPGCDKLHGTCKDKFNNLFNFRGEPFVPGMDTIMRMTYATPAAGPQSSGGGGKK